MEIRRVKALIINSGRGSRMKDYTINTHKSMVRLLNGETIFERQIRLLSECGIREIIVTVGYMKEQLFMASKSFPDLNFTFIDNPQYDNTNYIYSMYLAEDYLNDDMLVLHGDLVFNKRLLIDILKNENDSLCLYNEAKVLPEKDFKGRIRNGFLMEVSVKIFDDDCFAFQPLYKLSKENILAWMNEIKRFVQNGCVQVYAENALNNILSDLGIAAFSYKEHYIDEIDNVEDYLRVREEIRYFDFREQEVYIDDTLVKSLDQLLQINRVKKVFIVASESRGLPIIKILQGNSIDFVSFSRFSSNPKYEEITEGSALFSREKCDIIISIGGGSCIDTAKCIKLFSMQNADSTFSDSDFKFSNVKHLAIPTTAGSGSESTRFAVIYRNGEKLSITHDSILPDYVILNHAFLFTLPEYHKKSAILDAFCQAIESYWSKGATRESMDYSKKAIVLLLQNYRDYLCNNETSARNMLVAANISGKAINLTTTTAPHAMSYMLTSMYGLSHGQAVGLCLPYVWEYMYNNIEDFPLEKVRLLGLFLDISDFLECDDVSSAIAKMKRLYDDFKMPNELLSTLDIDTLTNTVNIERLNNNPVNLDRGAILSIYAEIKKKAGAAVES